MGLQDQKDRLFPVTIPQFSQERVTARAKSISVCPSYRISLLVEGCSELTVLIFPSRSAELPARFVLNSLLPLSPRRSR